MDVHFLRLSYPFAVRSAPHQVCVISFTWDDSSFAVAFCADPSRFRALRLGRHLEASIQNLRCWNTALDASAREQFILSIRCEYSSYLRGSSPRLAFHPFFVGFNRDSSEPADVTHMQQYQDHQPTHLEVHVTAWCPEFSQHLRNRSKHLTWLSIMSFLNIFLVRGPRVGCTGVRRQSVCGRS